ncbi:MAG: iron ABC transporter permease [Bacteroidetes bacterium]|nr:iron ABC transporter permease [Bacteroidota bacterium]
MSRAQRLILVLSAVVLAVLVLVAMGAGAVRVPPGAFLSVLTGGAGHDPQQEAVVLVIRLPRVLLSLLAGAALAVGGAAMQAVFRNPLADPSIIGVSSGAGMMAAFAIVLTASLSSLIGAWAATLSVPLFAFGGALLATTGVFAIARTGSRTNVAAMLLAGIAVTALTSAFTGLLTYSASDTQLRSLIFWMLGSLGGADRVGLLVLLAAVPLPLAYILRQHRALNALALGEAQARHLGMRPDRVKRGVVIATAVMTGATVALCGVIGFVGLVVPHVFRLAGGADNRYLLPASAIGGAALLCAADTLARTLLVPAELPIGVITALCGAPVFLYLLLRQKRTLHLA